MFTSRCAVVYIIIHMIISAFGVFVNTLRLPDHIPWVSTSRCETIRPKKETSFCADRSDICRWRSRTCYVMFYRATVVGRGRDWLSAHVWLSVERSRGVPIMLRSACADYVALSKSNPKRNAFNMFSTDKIVSIGLIWKN